MANKEYLKKLRILDPLVSQAQQESRRLFKYFFFTVFSFLLYQVVVVLSPFLDSLAAAAMLTIIFYPLHRRISARLKPRVGLGALVTTGLVFLIIVIPILVFAGG